MSTGLSANGRWERREAFWTLVVGAPASLSVLRLWVESGGELQTTLLLVSNVGPLNLGAALFATVTQLVTVVLIALLTAGGILHASTAATTDGGRPGSRVPLVARVAAAVPPWFVVATFGLAVLTWRIVFLPLLLPAAVATFQRPPWRISDRLSFGVGFCVVALAGYVWLVTPSVRDAIVLGEWLVAVLLVFPPLVSLGIAGPLPNWFGQVFALISQPAILGLAALAVWSALQTPILPLVVTEVRVDEGSELLRGHIISVDDVHMVLLQEQGGVRYLPVADIQITVICGTSQELPSFRTRVSGYHVEDSLLSALGRRVRPQVEIHPLCRLAQPPLLDGELLSPSG